MVTRAFITDWNIQIDTTIATVLQPIFCHSPERYVIMSTNPSLEPVLTAKVGTYLLFAYLYVTPIADGRSSYSSSHSGVLGQLACNFIYLL